jgi:hypothetical protein
MEREQEEFVMSKHEFIKAVGDIEPLNLWRQFPADELGPRDAAKIRRALRRVSIFGEPGWPDAARGVAAEAIGVAIRVAVKKSCVEEIVDVTMSAVVAAAIDGDPAAREFVAHMLMKRATSDAAAAALANSWIAANRAAERESRIIEARPQMRRPRNRQVASFGGIARRR